MVNAVILVFLTGGFLAYLQSHPGVVRVVNNTVTNTIALVSPEANPSPGEFLTSEVISFGNQNSNSKQQQEYLAVFL